MRRAGFTLLEIIVALGIFAVGATAAFALLVAGASSGRRAEHRINAALIAEQVLNDIQSEQLAHEDFDLSLFDPAGPLPDGANPDTVYVLHDAEASGYPDYRYDVAITPAGGPDPSRVWLYLVEVDVRWSEKGRGREAHFATLMRQAISAQNVPRATGQ
jgi:prepilin-type N-terminal cleavage/methylation domain-containing protein